ncbi:MAG: hypothetical protein C0402_06280 [Thermodesulfovibrio sp.]|nr:hypothetical protein [Thermodesulfovibrio sp.]
MSNGFVKSPQAALRLITRHGDLPDKGFTLLEIMIALAIVGGLLVTLIYTLNYNLGIAERHEFVTIASMLAKNRLLELETTPVNAEGDFPEPHAGYHFTAEVKKYSFAGISQLSVTVRQDKQEIRFSRLVEAKK